MEGGGLGIRDPSRLTMLSLPDAIDLGLGDEPRGCKLNGRYPHIAEGLAKRVGTARPPRPREPPALATIPGAAALGDTISRCPRSPRLGLAR
jgi:hypothetical protein